MKKGRIITSLVINILIIGVLVFAGLNGFLGWIGGKVFDAANLAPLFVPYGNLAAMFLGLASLMMIIVDLAMLGGKKGCRFVSLLKLLAAGASVVNLIVVVAYMCPVAAKGNFDALINPRFELYINLILPVLAIASMIFEVRPKLKATYPLIAILPIGFYLGAMFAMTAQSLIGAPYPFINPNVNALWISIVAVVGGVLGSVLVTYLLYLLRGACGKSSQDEEAPAEEEKPAEEAKPEGEEEPKPEGEEKPAEEPKPEGEEEPKEEPQPEAEPAADAEPEPEPEPEPQPEPKPRPAVRRPEAAPAPRRSVPYKGGTRTYHISKHPSGQWQIKLASSDKAIKLFDTQAEAIAYAKGLVESRGGSVRIHSVKGRMRRG